MIRRSSCSLPASLPALLALVATLAATPSQADPDPRPIARARFQAGTRHYNLGEFRAALEDFREAYRQISDAVFLFNMGQCQRMLGDYDAAIFSYRAYLRGKPDAPNREDVEERIAEMELAQRRRIQQAPPSGVFGEPATKPPSIEPPAAAAPTPEPTAPRAPAPASPPATTAARPVPRPAAAPVAAASSAPAASSTRDDLVVAARPEPSARTPVYKKWWLWTAVGVVAVAGAGVGLGVGLSGGDSIAASDLGNLDLR